MTSLRLLLVVPVVCLASCAEPPCPGGGEAGGDEAGGTDDADAGVTCTPRSADLSEFDRSCNDGADCAKVYVPGCTCDCTAVALNVHETQRYVDENRPCCAQADGTCGACFDATQPACRDGTCELVACPEDGPPGITPACPRWEP